MAKTDWKDIDFKLSELLKAIIAIAPLMAGVIIIIVQLAIYRAKIDWVVQEVVRIEEVLKMPPALPPNSAGKTDLSLSRDQPHKPLLGAD